MIQVPMDDGRPTRKQDSRMLELLDYRSLHKLSQPQQNWLSRLGIPHAVGVKPPIRLTFPIRGFDHVPRFSPRFREFVRYQQRLYNRRR